MLKALEALKAAREKKQAVLTGEAAKIVATANPEPPVSDKSATYLTSALKKWSQGSVRQAGADVVLRASGIHDVCPREFVLNYWMPKEKLSGFDVASNLRMSIGTELHSLFQNFFLGPLGILHGDWLSSNGTILQTETYHPDPELAMRELAKGTAPTWEYVEKTVYDEHLRISGHLDGMLNVDRVLWLQNNYRLVDQDAKKAVQRLHSLPCTDNLQPFELKTVNSFGYRRVVDGDSLPDYYKTQAEVYQKLTKTRNTLFCYINRDTMDFRFFNYSYTGAGWNLAVKKARTIWSAIRDESIPDSDLPCTKKTQKRAKQCPFSTECFSKTFSAKAFIAHAKHKQPERKFLDLSRWKAS